MPSLEELRGSIEIAGKRSAGLLITPLLEVFGEEPKVETDDRWQSYGGLGIEFVAFGCGETNRRLLFRRARLHSAGSADVPSAHEPRRVKIFALRAQCGRDVRVPSFKGRAKFKRRSATKKNFLNGLIDFLGKAAKSGVAI